jgi:hypothetical protein
MTWRKVHGCSKQPVLNSRASGHAPASLRSFIEVREYDAHRPVSFEQYDRPNNHAREALPVGPG